jgi:hypothetical protein
VNIPNSPFKAKTTHPAPNITTTAQPTDEPRYEPVQYQYSPQTDLNALLRFTRKRMAEVARMITDELKYSGKGFPPTYKASIAPWRFKKMITTSRILLQSASCMNIR